ncbi:prepilin-type N-terminal cleavage/methylation domain-containing protein [Aetokthonos hydrillicola Thurmond2011]|uniref:Prepilin-type N-terminal cleavage/methylation domain-containing protein n=1 Tax=Aetokthonos hydrillicola Thurmond2011 TaxID=2712845 RepID=A0AAP5I5I3_9CYAN|nr:prepilin-type N-terminal cleavage/methylation domain-containing protein [Aetokthonos hydrillicola]MBO3459789.1 prepilin-type N-terminal cleavage/methylation domain-containing protein [Aetokthonos hydrillicola CCALA 1050]MBW4584566.1 prepilin-type N-terminal cleavage/methylation domain-containing protein [Aetokthonos hydrillicola CCALA 1050]MDR9895109.1 prepilin-type N-terminal cleavage/methylation domain-containing protein [Aetokthonos hydrillicola Thurmond2011]
MNKQLNRGNRVERFFGGAPYVQLFLKDSEAGFSLIELLTVLALLAVLAAIAVPGWLGFMNRQRLTTAKRQAVALIRDAQANARRAKTSWQVCLSDNGTQVLSYVGPVPSTNDCQGANNEALIGQGSSDIKFQFTPTGSSTSTTSYRLQFNYDGSIADTSQLGKITFMPRSKGNYKACVSVDTLLGATRADQNACN